MENCTVEEFHCKVCTLSYTSKEALEEHGWSLIHQIKLSQQEVNGKPKCSLCSVEFDNLTEFSKHINTNTHKENVGIRRAQLQCLTQMQKENSKDCTSSPKKKKKKENLPQTPSGSSRDSSLNRNSPDSKPGRVKKKNKGEKKKGKVNNIGANLSQSSRSSDISSNNPSSSDSSMTERNKQNLTLTKSSKFPSKGGKKPKGKKEKSLSLDRNAGSRHFVSDMNLHESVRSLADNGPVSMDDFSTDMFVNDLDDNEMYTDFSDYHMPSPSSENLIGEQSWNNYGHGFAGSRESWNFGGSRFNWRPYYSNNVRVGNQINVPFTTSIGSKWRKESSSADERRRQWPVRDGPFLKPLKIPRNENMTERSRPKERKGISSEDNSAAGSSESRPSAVDAKQKKSKSDSPVRDDNKKLSQKTDRIIDNILKGVSAKGLLGAFPVKPATEAQEESNKTMESTEMTSSMLTSKPPKAPSISQQTGGQKASKRGGSNSLSLSQSAQSSKSQNQGLSKTSSQSEQSLSYSLEKRVQVGSCVENPDRGSYLLERAENLCRELREKRELAKSDNLKHLDLNRLEVRLEETRAKLAKKRDENSTKQLMLSSLRDSQASVTSESSSRAILQTPQEQCDEVRVTAQESPRRLSGDDDGITSARRKSPQGPRSHLFPIPARTRRNSESSSMEKKNLKRDMILKLVNEPRSRRDRKQISQMLKDFSKTSHASRPKITFTTPPQDQSSSTALSKEGVGDEESFDDLPAELEHEISAMISNLEERERIRSQEVINVDETSNSSLRDLEVVPADTEAPFAERSDHNDDSTPPVVGPTDKSITAPNIQTSAVTFTTPSSAKLTVERVDEDEMFDELPDELQKEISAMISNFENRRDTSSMEVIDLDDDTIPTRLIEQSKSYSPDVQIVSSERNPSSTGNEKSFGSYTIPEKSKKNASNDLISSKEIIQLTSAEALSLPVDVLDESLRPEKEGNAPTRSNREHDEESLSENLNSSNYKDSTEVCKNQETELDDLLMDSSMSIVELSPSRDNQETAGASNKFQEPEVLNESFELEIIPTPEKDQHHSNVSTEKNSVNSDSYQGKTVSEKSLRKNEELEQSVRSIFSSPSFPQEQDRQSKSDSHDKSQDEDLEAYMLSSRPESPIAPDVDTSTSTGNNRNTTEQDRDVSLVQYMLSFTGSVIEQHVGNADQNNTRGNTSESQTIFRPIEIRPESPEHMDISSIRHFNDGGASEFYAYRSERLVAQNVPHSGTNSPNVEMPLSGQNYQSIVNHNTQVVRSSENQNIASSEGNIDKTGTADNGSNTQNIPSSISLVTSQANIQTVVSQSMSTDNTRSPVITIAPMLNYATCSHTAVSDHEVVMEESENAEVVQQQANQLMEETDSDRRHKRPRSPTKQTTNNTGDSGSGSSKQDAKRLRYDEHLQTEQASLAKTPIRPTSTPKQSIHEELPMHDHASALGEDVMARVYELSVKEEKVRGKITDVDGAINELEALLEKTKEQLRRRQEMKEKLLNEEERLRKQRMLLLKGACHVQSDPHGTPNTTCDLREISSIPNVSDISDSNSALGPSSITRSSMEHRSAPVRSSSDINESGDQNVDPCGTRIRDISDYTNRLAETYNSLQSNNDQRVLNSSENEITPVHDSNTQEIIEPDSTIVTPPVLEDCQRQTYNGNGPQGGLVANCTSVPLEDFQNNRLNLSEGNSVALHDAQYTTPDSSTNIVNMDTTNDDTELQDSLQQKEQFTSFVAPSERPIVIDASPEKYNDTMCSVQPHVIVPTGNTDQTRNRAEEISQAKDTMLIDQNAVAPVVAPGLKVRYLGSFCSTSMEGQYLQKLVAAPSQERGLNDQEVEENDEVNRESGSEGEESTETEDSTETIESDNSLNTSTNTVIPAPGLSINNMDSFSRTSMSDRKKQENQSRKNRRSVECVVCGKNAGEIKFGVMSCSSCAQNFAAVVQAKAIDIDPCPDTKKCDRNKDGQVGCLYCHYMKCLAMGMKREEVPRKGGATKTKELTAATSSQVTLPSTSPKRLKSPKRRSRRIKNQRLKLEEDSDTDEEQTLPHAPSPVRRSTRKKNREKFVKKLVKEYLHGESSTDVEIKGLERIESHPLPQNREAVEKTRSSPDKKDKKTKQLSNDTEGKKHIGKHIQSVRCMVLWGGFIVSGSEDNAVFKINIEERKCVLRFKGHTKAISCLHVSDTLQKDKPVLYSGSNDKFLRIFNFTDGSVIGRVLFPHQIYCLHECNETIYVGLINGSLVCYSMKENKALRAYSFSKRPILAIDSIPQKNWLVIATADSSITVRDVENDQLMCTIEGHTNSPTCLQVVGNSIYSAGLDRTLQVHDISTGDPIQTVRYNSWVSAMIVYGNLVIITLHNGVNHIYLKETLDMVCSFYGSNTFNTRSKYLTALKCRDNVIYCGMKDGSVGSLDVNLDVLWRCKFGVCNSLWCTRKDLLVHSIDEHVRPHSTTLCLWPQDGEPCSKKISAQTAMEHLETHFDSAKETQDKIVFT